MIGYKSFSINNTNIYGKNFDIYLKYHVDGDIKFGSNGNGFHFCKRFEDTIRYNGFIENSILHDVNIAKVKASGQIVEGNDEYNGYYDMYACSDIEIICIMKRKEIIDMALNLPLNRMIRFVSLYRLYDSEIDLFRDKSFEINQALDYFQLGDIDCYNFDKKSKKLQLYNSFK